MKSASHIGNHAVIYYSSSGNSIGGGKSHVQKYTTKLGKYFPNSNQDEKYCRLDSCSTSFLSF